MIRAEPHHLEFEMNPERKKETMKFTKIKS